MKSDDTFDWEEYFERPRDYQTGRYYTGEIRVGSKNFASKLNSLPSKMRSCLS